MSPRLTNIRCQISVISVVIFILAIGMAYVASRDLSYEHTNYDSRTKIRNKLNYIQGAAEQLIKSGMTNILHQIISSTSSEPDLKNIIIVDQEDTVLVSNNLSEAGRNWRELNIKLDEESIRHVKQAKKTLLVHNREEGYLEGYVSICSKTESRSLRVGKCGFSIYRIDLAYHYALTRQALNLQSFYFAIGMTITIMVMFVVMHFWLNKPAYKMITSLRQFNEGDHEQRIEVKNNNEISLISKAINQVLDTVVDDEKALQNKEERLRAIFDNTIDSIITINSKGIIETVNPATESLFGYKPDELIGKNISILTPEPHRAQHDQYLESYLETGKGGIIGNSRELNAITRDGTQIDIALTVTEIMISGKKCFTGIIRDITEQLELRKAMARNNDDLINANLELKRISRTDPLTGIANRRLFDETLEVEIRRATRQGEPLSLIMLDVDYFKLYNDRYGHNQGDLCLQRVAAAMSDCFQRAGELPARYGGEEFCVILPGTDNQRVRELAEKYREAIWQLQIPHEKSDIADRVSVSIGVTTFLSTSSSFVSNSELINSADKALYQAKSSGRNKVCGAVFSSDNPASGISCDSLVKTRAI